MGCAYTDTAHKHTHTHCQVFFFFVLVEMSFFFSSSLAAMIVTVCVCVLFTGLHTAVGPSNESVASTVRVVWNIEKHAPHKKPPTPDESSSRQIKEIGENEPNERQE